jgi:acetyltransferase
MHKFFNPKSVAVIGAPSKTGPGALNNVENMLQYGYEGRIYPINPKVKEICGLKVYPSVLEIPEPVDLVVISVGRDRALSLFEECVQAGIRRVVIISQGFADADWRGAELQKHIVEQAKKNNVRVLGPNTMGLLNNFQNLSTGFVDIPKPEKYPHVSLVAQTGVIQLAPKDFAYNSWGKAIDIGNMGDVDFVDALEYFADDPETEVIALHMEGMKRGREFLEIASKITPHKPIVVIKTGRSSAGAEAALSHTASLVGEDAVFDAVFKRAGIIRANNAAELQDTLRALVCLKAMEGPKIGIVTVTGAAGIMAVDACEEEGLELAELPQGLSEKLKRGVPEWIHIGNPLDIWPVGMIGGNVPGAVCMAVTELLKSPDVDGVIMIALAVNSPLHTDVVDFTEVLSEARRTAGNNKPIAIWPYADDHSFFPDLYEAIDGVASFRSPEQAVKGLSSCYKYHKLQNREIPSGKHFIIDRDKVDPLLERGRKQKVLAGEDALCLLNAFGIPVVRGAVAGNWEELEAAASELDNPLVLKLSGSAFLHKSEWSGVKTGIETTVELREAFREMSESVFRIDPKLKIEAFQLQEQAFGKELLLGLKQDPQFGPVIACGMGGIYTEVFRDISREIVPINRSIAKGMIESLRIYPLLKGVRGEVGVDMEALLNVLERLSFLAVEIPDLLELDINPLLVSEIGCRAVDARLLW